MAFLKMTECVPTVKVLCPPKVNKNCHSLCDFHKNKFYTLIYTFIWVGNLDMSTFENWKNQGKKASKKQESYYAKPCPELGLRLDNNFKCHLKPLTNGGTVKSSLRKIGAFSVSLSNTCTTDSLLHLCATTYADSENFRVFCDAADSRFLKIVAQMCREGTTAKTYQLRSEMLFECLKEDRTDVSFNVVHLNCARTPDELLARLDVPPSIVDHLVCSSPHCPQSEDRRKVPFIGAHPATLVKMGIGSLEDALIQNNLDTDVTSCLKSFTAEQLTDIPLPSEFVTNYPPDKTVSKNVLCSGSAQHRQKVQEAVFVSLVGDVSSVLHRSDLASTEKYLYCSLEDIPTSIMILGEKRHLRGVVAACPPRVGRGTTFKNVGIGHFMTYSRRIGGRWEEWDDMKSKPTPIKPGSTIFAVLLLYTQL